eukprot:GHUV01026584.1.p2 GENE.GHUV01026584.1~~GHUV01026584.1.p2  ORF type:complete len:129 (-),score=7.63 GHUV01026584.1:314-700(-)
MPTIIEELKKGAWTPEEDILLRRLVESHGPQKWSVIAEKIKGRSGKSCRLRWWNHLNPEVKKGTFSDWEDAVIIKVSITVPRYVLGIDVGVVLGCLPMFRVFASVLSADHQVCFCCAGTRVQWQQVVR